MVDEITIRAYRRDDQSATIDIHDRARPIELQGACDARAFVPLVDDREDFEEFLSARKLVAERDEQVLGFVGIEDDQVGWLYVDPDCARQGIGRQLLRQALALIGQGSQVHVLEGNKPALALYLSEGFRRFDQFDSNNHGYPCRILMLVRPAD
ncbi:GNAT family N-acetyltransferase [Pseudomonadales bacterium]|nr:GNAT family N-acetyltransferase [Pseudomonadales bacterium]MDB9879878.1 GNAT family N-acetyltransferase [Pseudomonadales bacterium]MDC0013546.1 GNAT family N-acetyltransferase [Pseudomonadales bacterium]MDC0174369.1 GNAT family N-acetyltransferase [Pseudomonadales bacterium]MDC1308354.1 GNAT family N-acetyltransferase [Pseudomonadales bacterium]|tara:strand:- start:390 stop:848 length:459 start_codon:yes stop_codon:yes gene_type:complete